MVQITLDWIYFNNEKKITLRSSVFLVLFIIILRCGCNSPLEAWIVSEANMFMLSLSYSYFYLFYI